MRGAHQVKRLSLLICTSHAHHRHASPHPRQSSSVATRTFSYCSCHLIEMAINAPCTSLVCKSSVSSALLRRDACVHTWTLPRVNEACQQNPGLHECVTASPSINAGSNDDLHPSMISPACLQSEAEPSFNILPAHTEAVKSGQHVTTRQPAANHSGMSLATAQAQL